MGCCLTLNPAAKAGDKWPDLLVPAAETSICLSADLPQQIKSEATSVCRLIELDGAQATFPAQIVPSLNPSGLAAKQVGRLLAVIAPRPGAREPRRFRLSTEALSTEQKNGFRFEEINDKQLRLWEGDRPVWQYNHGLITAEGLPKNEPRRSRADYIHPLWGLQGEVLTDDFPKDHYHHHGVFWTWPYVTVDNREYDLWLSQNIQQRFVRWLCRESGPVGAVLGVENGWFIGDAKVMVERLWLQVYRSSEDSRAMDVALTLIPTDKPVTLRGADAKGYGGMTIRFNVRNDKEVAIATPEGKIQDDQKGQQSYAWADLTARFPGASSRSGAALFIHPRHSGYTPSWLLRHYGPICASWPGVKGKTLTVGQAHQMSYRIWLHQTAGDVEQINRVYAAYSAAAEHVKWEP